MISGGRREPGQANRTAGAGEASGTPLTHALATASCRRRPRTQKADLDSGGAQQRRSAQEPSSHARSHATCAKRLGASMTQRLSIKPPHPCDGRRGARSARTGSVEVHKRVGHVVGGRAGNASSRPPPPPDADAKRIRGCPWRPDPRWPAARQWVAVCGLLLIAGFMAARTSVVPLSASLGAPCTDGRGPGALVQPGGGQHAVMRRCGIGRGLVGSRHAARGETGEVHRVARGVPGAAASAGVLWLLWLLV